jgi:(1->4)-alpha-D-glucan 1-alpha-D-glucosylmutase
MNVPSANPSAALLPPANNADESSVESRPPADSAETSALAARILNGVRRRVESTRRPRATVRVQFNKDFTFRQATALVPYWHALGISDVYASPYLKAARGSGHGYDIVDHASLNPEVGSEADFAGFVAALRAHGRGHILDFVPNHMGVGTDENAWWQDVLENGPGSDYASFFDIDWDPLKPDLQHKVLLPVLGDQFGRVLESRQLTLEFSEGGFCIRYFGRRFPVAPKSTALILRHRADVLASRMAADDPLYLEYQSIITAITHLPPRHETDPVKLEERQREKEVIKRRLQRLCEECRHVRELLVENVEIFNGKDGEPASFNLLDELLMDQPYRLSFWRVASDEINYRRFFDVNELAALCMERPEVFERAHALVFQLLERNELDGLRIDHADGLYDPTEYLWQLQERRFLQLCEAECPELPAKHPEVREALRREYASLRAAEPNSAVVQPLYLVVEKILERHERLPENWPVNGTTGYDFLNDVNGLFVDEANGKIMAANYARFIGEKLDFAQMTYEAKLLIMRASMSSELHALGHKLDRLSERSRWTRDFTLHGLLQALRQVIACFPVYRTYTVGTQVLDRDRRYIEQAVARARHRNPAVSGDIFDFVRDVLVLRGHEALSAEDRTERQNFVGRFQQFTGPMMAKAVEDTTYYRFNRLVSLNEVGGDPERFGVGVEEFHRLNQERQSQRPFELLATTTHDTKRSEDVRARINLLSEIPLEWKQRVAQWARWNKRKKSKVDGELTPVRNDEYLLYQTLVGTWPFEPPHAEALAAYVARIKQYMTKALRESKQYTSWIAPNEAYERSLDSFIEEILSDVPLSAFRTDFEPFARKIAAWGIWNSLGQTLLKLCSPGVPDIYRGTEFWELSLVDPDNRRPVDFELRQKILDELRSRSNGPGGRQQLVADLLASATDGAVKLFVIFEALALRRKSPDLFTTGAYVPLPAEGARESHLCAFARVGPEHSALVVVPRLVTRLTNESQAAPIGQAVWENTLLRLPPEFAGSRWRNVFTGAEIACDSDRSLAVDQVLAAFPVALLESQTSASAG